MKNLVLRAYHRVPIFEWNLYLYVSHDATKTRNRVAKRWGFKPTTAFDAGSISDGEGEFALFFNHGNLSDNDIAHEVDHLVNGFMMPFIGQSRCKKCNNEPHAFVVGYVTQWVKKQLRRAHLRVR